MGDTLWQDHRIDRRFAVRIYLSLGGILEDPDFQSFCSVRLWSRTVDRQSGGMEGSPRGDRSGQVVQEIGLFPASAGTIFLNGKVRFPCPGVW